MTRGSSFVRDPKAHHGAIRLGAAYYVETAGSERDGYNSVREIVRRARGFAVLGRASVARAGRASWPSSSADCSHARRMAAALATAPGVTILLNEVVLNQALVRFEALDGDVEAGDRRTREVIEAVQRDGTCWLGGTTWRGRAAMRFSVSGWQTTEADIDRSAAAILSCLAEVDGRVPAPR